MTANMITFMVNTAAADSVKIHIGSALLVFSIRPLDPNSGSKRIRFALLKAVAARVRENWQNDFEFIF